jgi:hypothetical protein
MPAGEYAGVKAWTMSMSSCLAVGEARRPPAVVALPAEDGRRRRPSAEPALRQWRRS